jgi:hypothetical protein
MLSKDLNLWDIVKVTDKRGIQNGNGISILKHSQHDNSKFGLEKIEDHRGIVKMSDDDWIVIEWFGGSSIYVIENRPEHLKVYSKCEGMNNINLCMECNNRSHCWVYSEYIENFD